MRCGKIVFTPVYIRNNPTAGAAAGLKPCCFRTHCHTFTAGAVLNFERHVLFVVHFAKNCRVCRRTIETIPLPALREYMKQPVLLLGTLSLLVQCWMLNHNRCCLSVCELGVYAGACSKQSCCRCGGSI